MSKRFLSVLILLVAFAPLTLSASTVEELQAQISQLLAQITQLQKQIEAAKAAATQQPSSGAEVAVLCFEGTRTLKRGMRGDDVRQLQRLLRQTDDFREEATGYFGALTERAVQRWQSRNRIITYGSPDTTGFGVVGPKTRAAMSCTVTKSVATSTPNLTQGNGANQNCVAGSVVIAHGASARFYLQAKAPEGIACSSASQARGCENGILGGDPQYEHLVCTEADATTCAVGGITLKDGESGTFYSAATVLSGDSCASYEQTRTCTKGVLSGSASYFHTLCVAGDYYGASPYTGGYTPYTPYTGTTTTGGGGSYQLGGSAAATPCPYKGTNYPDGMRTEGTDINNLCLGADLTLCLVGSKALPQFECRNGIWTPGAAATDWNLPSPTTFNGDCTPAQIGCHFCIAGNYGYWTMAQKCSEEL